MRQIHLLRVARHDSIDCFVRFHRIKLHGRRCRKNNLALVSVVLAIRHTETVAGKYAFRLRVVQYMVVPRMSLGIDRLQRAAVEREPLLIFRYDYALLIDRFDSAVQSLGLCLAVNGLGSRDQLRWVHHVPRPVAVHYAFGVRQLLHEATSAAGMIEVHVRKNDVVDVSDVEVLLNEGVQKQRNAVIDAGIDKRRTTLFDDQMARVV